MTRAVGAWLSALLVAMPAVAQEAPAPAPAQTTPVRPEPDPLLPLKTTVELRGRIEADAVFATQSPQSKALLGDFENAYGFRRARLGAQGTVGTSARWVAEVDFASSSPKLRDTYVGLLAIPGVNAVQVGYFREPFSLEGATSSRSITFMERSPLNVLDPTRNWGVAGYWLAENERVFFATGVFRDGTDSAGRSTGDGSAAAFTSRLTGLPVYESDDAAFRLVHLGAAVSYRNPAGGVVRYQPEPQSSLVSVSDNPLSPFLPTVNVPANSQQLYNLQAAGVYGPASLQAEWFGSAVQQRGAGVVFLHGFYVNGSYFLTGEHRGYSPRSAEFDRVKVHRPVMRSDGTVAGPGAIELAARFAVADFQSANLPPTSAVSPTGAVLYQATFGANWYLNDYTRVMFNYTLSIADSPAAPAVAVHVFSARTEINW